MTGPLARIQRAARPGIGGQHKLETPAPLRQAGGFVNNRIPRSGRPKALQTVGFHPPTPCPSTINPGK
jgi:hypothetical protein